MVKDQGSNASKSVRFQLDRQTSLEINFCPSELEEEEDSKTGGDNLENIQEEEEESHKEQPRVDMKPMNPLGKSPLSPLSPLGRPSSPMLNPGAGQLGSPSRKPPARLNPLAPLGKTEINLTELRTQLEAVEY